MRLDYVFSELDLDQKFEIATNTWKVRVAKRMVDNIV